MRTQKLLLPFGASTVIGHITDQLLHCSLDQVLVVTGSDTPAVEAALKGQPIRFATNPDPDAEMLSSVRCGLAALPEGCDTVLLALGDQPGIQRELVEQLIQEHRSARGSVVVPFYRGHRGHPFLFPARYRDEILSGYDQTGMRGFLDAHAEETIKVEVQTASVLDDVDYPEDYQRALKH